MATCLIGLGANLGDKAQQLSRAVSRLSKHRDISIRAISGYHTTPPVGGPSGQDEYLNAALLLSTSLTPAALLAMLQTVEAELGRQRGERWSARAIDLDLLLYDDVCCRTPTLELPHPRMAFRRFVLAAASEIAAGMIHPVTGWTIQRLLEHLDSSAEYVACTGDAPHTGELAKFAADRCGAHLISCSTARRSRVNLPDLLDETRDLAALLDKERIHAAVPVVSDEWFGEPLTVGRRNLADDEFELLERQWRLQLNSVANPRLLVFIESAPAQNTLEWARRLDQGPVLQVDAAEPEAARDEILAAIQAMH